MQSSTPLLSSFQEHMFTILGGFIYGLLIALVIIERLPLSFFGKGNGCGPKLRIASLKLFGATSNCDGLTTPCPSCQYISCAPMPFWSDDKWWYCDGCDAVNGQAVKDEFSQFFNEIEVSCPYGGLEVVDISVYQFTELKQVKGILSDYCRKLC